jgi:hypothetical protein
MTRPGPFVVAGALAGLLAAGCATPAGPRQEIARAELALRGAETSAAADVSAAEIQLARERLERARRALEDGDEEAARRSAAEATADAELAEARGEAAAARTARIEIERRLRVPRP